MTVRTPPSLYFENTHLYHEVEERVYELSDLRAGNVRDQIVRATYLTRSLIRDKFLTPDSPLLVFGGGAAGMSCASVALAAGIQVWVLELDKHPFATQLATSTRTIDPAEFDWPETYWETGDIPDDAMAGFALRYQRGFADAVAAGWLMLSDDWEEDGQLILVQATDARTFSWSRNATGIVVDNLRHPRNGTAAPIFGAIVSCVGWGNEVVYDVEGRWAYRGVKFWAPDTLHRARLGLSITAAKRIQVLVSGGGDGAHQDIQRILTGLFGRDLVEKLRTAPVPDAKFSKLFDDLGVKCLPIDDMVWDSVDWQEHKEPSASAQQKWHQGYEALVDQAFASMSPDEQQWQRENILRKEVQRGDVALWWLLRGLHPSVCYPLNRLLTLWLLRLYADVSERPLLFQRPDVNNQVPDFDAIIVAGYEIQKVQAGAIGHVCGDRRQCFGREHLVHVRRSDGKGRSTLMGTFHELVLRHGVVPLPVFPKSARKLMLRSTDLRQR